MYTFPDWKIVLIDDEEDILDVMTISLEDSGCQVETAANGEAELRL
jgi:DNA-binding response OmpR family regulator